MNSNRLSCENFLPEFSTSSDPMCKDPCSKLKEEQPAKSSSEHNNNEPEKCLSLTTTSTSSYMSCGIMQDICHSTKPAPQKPPNIEYEVAVAKSIMQELSTISGDNLFDHLSDIIKRIIDERPPNVIDFFEEFSRNVREQKFHLPERFPPDTIFEETRMFKVAQKQLISMKLPYPPEGMTMQNLAEDDLEEERSKDELLKIELKPEPLIKLRTFNDRVQHLQFFWNQCGFSISSDDIFQLACSMNRLQTHPSIRECRFWGMINGLKASYYIVEVSLTNEECESRLIQMENEIQENELKENQTESKENIHMSSHIGPELTPGNIGWDNYPVEELMKMKPNAAEVPRVKPIEVFDVPPEPIGRGVNRYSYFVVNSLSDDWIELPLVTPKQVALSRKIKKFFTGDLEAEIVSYPCFNGKEKHYLRATIGRITAGTYIAPRDYYRKMTEKERRLYEGEEPEEGEEEEEEDEGDESTADEGEEEAEEGIPNNDIVLLKNEKYDATIPIKTLNTTEMWLHVRPSILIQGRVVWFDEEKAQRERERERLRLEKLRLRGEMEEEEYNEEEDEEEGEQEQEEEEIEVHPEIGPAILSPCTYDVYPETPVAWTARFTSKFTNENERILIMQSNTWPGAYTFVYKDLCESIYLGWGHKYVARNMAWTHLPPIVDEYPHMNNDFIEAIDPSVEMEEAYRLSLLKKDLQLTYDNYEENEMGSTEAETDDDDEAEDRQ